MQHVPSEKPAPPKRSTFRWEKFFKDLMKKKEEEKAMKERSSVTVTADVHHDVPKETPRWPAAERKQQTPEQLLTSGRFSMSVDTVNVDVEVLSSNAKKAVASSLASNIIARCFQQREPEKQRQQVVVPLAPISCLRPPWANVLPLVRPQASLQAGQVQPHLQATLQPQSLDDTRCVASAVREIRFRADQLGNRRQRLPFEMDEYLKEMVAKAKDIKKH